MAILLTRRIELQFVLVMEHLKPNADVRKAMSDMALLVKYIDEYNTKNIGFLQKRKFETLWKMLMRRWGKT
jgi:hypothetical protein